MGGLDRLLDLVQVRLRLDEDQVGARLGERFDLLEECIEGLGRAHPPKGRESNPQRPHGPSHQDPGPPGHLDSRAVQLVDAVSHVPTSKSEAVRPERVREDDRGAGIDEAPVDALDQTRIVEVQGLETDPDGDARIHE